MCDHGGHGHDHSCAQESQITPDVFVYDLHQKIDKSQVTVLNEAQEGSGLTVFKAMSNKNDKTAYVESDCDQELLFNIPFTGHVKIMGLAITGDDGQTHPAKIRLFKDRLAMSFDDCSIEADQEIDLKQDPMGVVDYPLKAMKFSSVSHLSIQITQNFGDDVTRVYYIGLRGEYVHDFRAKIAIATYESRPMTKDHKGEIPNAVGRTLF